MKRVLFLTTPFLLMLGMSMGCQQNTNYTANADAPMELHKAMRQLTDVIVHDIFSPPVASRIYAYPSIAAYEVFRQGNPDYQTLAGQLHALEAFPQPKAELEYDFTLAGLQAFIEVGKMLIFSEDKIQGYQDTLYLRFKKQGIPRDVFKNSVAYGDAVAAHVLAWADKDNYKQTRTFPKYTVTQEDGRWKPTPPAYMEGIEPHWNQIRPFIIDSATQFVPIRPSEYDMRKTSTFYDEVMEVYETSRTLTDEQVEIARFWDCNPYVSNVQGHVMFATKKITPGGHWIGITDIVTRQVEANLIQTSEAYARVSIALADAFISCWDEKYRSNLIRPETVINEHLDPDWTPILQTPPFPEYTSGHSVISRSAAVTLTDLMGDNFSFVDSTEVKYGLPPRNFSSFLHASEEAAISRLYGGIHYMPAIDNGVKQGEKVGEYIVAHLSTGPKPLSSGD